MAAFQFFFSEDIFFVEGIPFWETQCIASIETLLFFDQPSCRDRIRRGGATQICQKKSQSK
jgi:hypothetical protein